MRRPRTRGECDELVPVDGTRRCPWYACRYHLGLVIVHGSHVVARDLDELTETCALDVADRGEHTLEYIAGLLGVTKQGAQQCEEKALRRLGRKPALRRLAEE